MLDVIVVGGGIAGLSCAWRLAGRGQNLLLLEANPQPGGNIRTYESEGYRFENGPHSFMGSADDVFDLAEECELGSQVTGTRPQAKTRFIARYGRIHQAPDGPLSFLTTGLLTLGGKLRLMTEPLRLERGDIKDSAQTFFERRFGPEATDILIGAFISGVYAGDPRLLSAAAAFPLFWQFEVDSGSMIRGAYGWMQRRKAERVAQGRPVRKGLFAFEKGMGQLTAGVAAKLGDRCRLGTPVESIQRSGEGFSVKMANGTGETFSARKLVLAVPPPEASRLTLSMNPSLAGLLAGIPMAPIAVVHLGFEQRCSEVPDGFGFLVPRSEGIRSLGVLFPSRLFEGRAPEGGDLLAGFVGGMLDPKALDLNDEDLASIVTNDLRNLIQLEQKPSFVRVLRYSHAIPQFVSGHLERMKSIQLDLQSLPGLQLAGNYLRGVGVKDAVRSGFDAADSIAPGM